MSQQRPAGIRAPLPIPGVYNDTRGILRQQKKQATVFSSLRPPRLDFMPLILEGLVTTVNADGTANVAPMGPIVDERMERFLLRPFQTTATYRNLRRTGQGVLHVTDDAALLAQAAVGVPDPAPSMRWDPSCQGWILCDACRWYAFSVAEVNDQQERTEIAACVTASGRQRDFFGFNRAKHAVIEAAILATRQHLIEPAVLLAEFDRLQSPVEKTGGPAELHAMQQLREFILRNHALPSDAG